MSRDDEESIAMITITRSICHSNKLVKIILQLTTLQREAQDFVVSAGNYKKEFPCSIVSKK